MIWGDQWICSCGVHNLEVREKCRGCRKPKSEAVNEENWQDVVTNIAHKSLEELKAEEFIPITEP